jgi:hypothetical protein
MNMITTPRQYTTICHFHLENRVPKLANHSQGEDVQVSNNEMEFSEEEQGKGYGCGLQTPSSTTGMPEELRLQNPWKTMQYPGRTAIHQEEGTTRSCFPHQIPGRANS